MKMQELREKAKEFGLKTGRMKKVDLIRAIQSEEGNTPCFKTTDTSCDQVDCLWRNDCFKQ